VTEEEIRSLLAKADERADQSAFGNVTAAEIRRRAHRRRFVRIAVPTTVAATIAVTVAWWGIHVRTEMAPPQPQPQRIASLEEQVRQLRLQTEATLKLVQDVLEKDRQERHLASLEAELASIPDPVKEVERQVDKTAFILVYQADKLYQELNQTESAVRAYREVIQLFPTNRWADVARERLSQIEQRRINKPEKSKGAAKCEPRNA